jgi:hypothetical protein
VSVGRLSNAQAIAIGGIAEDNLSLDLRLQFEPRVGPSLGDVVVHAGPRKVRITPGGKTIREETDRG